MQSKRKKIDVKYFFFLVAYFFSKPEKKTWGEAVSFIAGRTWYAAPNKAQGSDEDSNLLSNIHHTRNSSHQNSLSVKKPSNVPLTGVRNGVPLNKQVLYHIADHRLTIMQQHRPFSSDEGHSRNASLALQNVTEQLSSLKKIDENDTFSKKKSDKTHKTGNNHNYVNENNNVDEIIDKNNFDNNNNNNKNNKNKNKNSNKNNSSSERNNNKQYISESILTIEGLLARDSGHYQCISFNSLGSAFVTFDVLVQGDFSVVWLSVFFNTNLINKSHCKAPKQAAEVLLFYHWENEGVPDCELFYKKVLSYRYFSIIKYNTIKNTGFIVAVTPESSIFNTF